MKARTRIIASAFLLTLMLWEWSIPALSQTPSPPFTFVVTSDPHDSTGLAHNTCEYFRGACTQIDAAGEGVFMITSGDLSPGADARWTITDVLGPDYLWYPTAGNHEMPLYGGNTNWLRSYNYDANGVGNPPDIVRSGPSGCPATTYSFDYANAHFAVLNEYCDVGGDMALNGDADIRDHLYNWLVADLAATSQPFVFVIGHEPAYPQPDADNGRERHMTDSLNQYPANRNRFWNLLAAEDVTAYFCGHTHNYSAVRVNEVWQINVGHARGLGDPGAPSTFVRATVGSSQVTYEVYRTNTSDYCEYNLTRTWSTGPTAVTVRSLSAKAASRALVGVLAIAALGGLALLASGLIRRRN